MTHSRSALAACAVLALLGSASANAAPAPGHYDARLCVATSDAAPSCGPARVDWRSGQRVQVQISDVVYRLKLHSSQLDVVLMQGSMQLDEFSADYAWQGDTLQFADRDKGARYELQLGARKR